MVHRLFGHSGGEHPVRYHSQAMPSVSSRPSVSPFARRLLADEFPGLSDDHLDETVEFVCRRIDTIPSLTRIGAVSIAIASRGAMALIGERRVVRTMAHHPVPLLGEYVRLIRSLAYAYIWEAWPDTLPDGTAPS